MNKWRYSKFKRGTPLEITLRFGNGEREKVIGYYWQNSRKEQRIELTSHWPPVKFEGKLMNKSFCHYDMMERIVRIQEWVLN